MRVHLSTRRLVARSLSLSAAGADKASKTSVGLVLYGLIIENILLRIETSPKRAGGGLPQYYTKPSPFISLFNLSQAY
ncbi:MAG TPA: hypothetical protein VFJ84_02550 [Candidatus Saccharimonadales bacterium]|nr:hypothetical protein [Candidatus Saccharimonadales bacterium]